MNTRRSLFTSLLALIGVGVAAKALPAATVTVKPWQLKGGPLRGTILSIRAEIDAFLAEAEKCHRIEISSGKTILFDRKSESAIVTDLDARTVTYERSKPFKTPPGCTRHDMKDFMRPTPIAYVDRDFFERLLAHPSVKRLGGV